MKKFGLVGRKLRHSYSPLIHSYLGDYEYSIYERESDQLDELFNDAGIAGLNITIPYKFEAIKYCAQLSQTAMKTGSVNTVVRLDDGTLHGENTDYYGFQQSVVKSGIQVENKKVLLLGDGGAAATIKVVMYDLGVGSLVTVSRKGADNYSNIDKHYDADIIINSTPVGMYPDNYNTVIDISAFKKCIALFDLIYNPSNTRLMLDAKKNDIPAFNGLYMLVAQAKEAAQLFTEKNIDDDLIDVIVNKVSIVSKNIILTGMPGCGKSSIAKKLAGETNRPFMDTDIEIENKYKMHPSQIIKQKGEPYFRDIETDLLSDITKNSGYVIATGGGVVTRECNKDLLKQNGTVIFIERDLDKLVTKGRPLSESEGLYNLYNQRIDNYITWSDYVIENQGIRETALEIKEVLGL